MFDNTRNIFILCLLSVFTLLLFGCSEVSQPLSDRDATEEPKEQVIAEPFIESTIETKVMPGVENELVKEIEVEENLEKEVVKQSEVEENLEKEATKEVEADAEEIPEVEKEVVKQSEVQNRDELDGIHLCDERGTKKFTSSVFPSHLITVIEPMGKMGASHVTPTDHLYVYRDIWEGEDTDYVLAPTDGWIVSISNNEERTARWDSSITVPDRRIVFMHTCTFFTIFIHLGDLAPAVTAHTGELPPDSKWWATQSSPVLVKAGDPIAKMGLTGFDWSVHDTDTILPGFVIPDHYEGENWKIHTVDPFQFFDDPLKSELLSKAVRKVEPQAGKIDYDVEDTISGNWFQDGSDDYRGLEGGGGEYWKTHLTIAYGWIEPTMIRISIGFDTEIDDDKYCNVCFGAYGVRDNQPDPATIGPEEGLIKYELMSRTGPNHEQIGTTSLGTFLVQHLGDRTIQVEVIEGKAPDDVADFSDASLIFRR